MSIAQQRDEDAAGTAPVVILIVAVIAVVAVLFYGLIFQHWFGFDVGTTVNPAPSVVPTPSPSPTS